jgi:hypothetical protein
MGRVTPTDWRQTADMIKQSAIWTVLFFLAGISIGLDHCFAKNTVDYSIYSRLLSDYVKEGVVSYQGLKKDEALLDDYLAKMAEVNPDELTRQEAMAFFINLYNAWTIKLILSAYPGIESIKELGTLFRSPWQKKIVNLNGKTVTLDHIEHDILRPRFKDPRVHFAINCASKGCPPLLDQPFNGADLDRQLDQVTQAFVNDPLRNYVRGNTLYVSRIFKWFGSDFNNEILPFFTRYARGHLKQQLSQGRSQLKLSFLDYDWSLNGF